MKAASNRSTKPREGEMKTKSTCEALNYVPNRHKGQPSYKKQALPIVLSNSIHGYKS